MGAIPVQYMSEMIEDNTAEYFLYLGRINGSEVVDEPGIKCVFSSCGHNRILRARFSDAEADEAVGVIVSRLKALDIPALWMINAGVSAPGLPGVLLRHGFSYIKDWKSMAIDVSTIEIDGTVPAGLEIQEARSRKVLAAWSEVLLTSFDIRGDIREVYGEYLTRKSAVNGLRHYHYLGLLDGEPVASAALFKGKESAGIYWVGTLPQARNKGIGGAMTRRALLEARASGYRVATLNASDAGHLLYRKLGFIDYFSTNIYQWKDIRNRTS